MAKRKNRRAAQLEGADEFLGEDPEKEAIEKIAAARAAATKEAEQDSGDNGGPPLDEAAWLRAVNEYTAEMLDMEDLESKKAEIAGRISSIRKVAKKLKVEWDLVKRYYEEHRSIRKGGMGAMVTDERRYRWLLKVMGSPLHTQFGLWEHLEASADAQPKDERSLEAEATLAGEHAGMNGEPSSNCPYQAGTPQAFGWRNGHQVGADKLTDSFKTGALPTASSDDAAH